MKNVLFCLALIPALLTAQPIIETIAGSPGTNVAGPEMWFNFPKSLALDPDGNIYVTVGYPPYGGFLTAIHLVYRVDGRTGNVTIIGGNPFGVEGFGGDGGPAYSETAQVNFPGGIVVDAAGNVIFADTANHCVRRIGAETGIITTIAGIGEQPGYSGDGGPATSAKLNFPADIAFDRNGNLFISDTRNLALRRVDAATARISTVATGLRYTLEGSLAVDQDGNVYIAEPFANRVRKWNASNGSTEVVAGNGTDGYGGDGRLAINARLQRPADLAFDKDNNLLIATGGRIRRVDRRTGIISTIAGNGKDGPSPDGERAADVPLGASGLTLDKDGNMFVLASGSVRRIDAVNGTLSTLAGGGPEYRGDGGPAREANIYRTWDVVADGAGNLYYSFVDLGGIVRVDAVTGRINKISSEKPIGMGVDRAGNLFFVDGYRVRRIDAVTGAHTTVAGDGRAMWAGDGGPATEASIIAYDVAVDERGNLYIAGSGLRRVDAETGIITTISYGDVMPAGRVAVDHLGNVYVSALSPFFVAIMKFDPVSGVITKIADKGGYGIAVDLDGNIYFPGLNNPRIFKVDAKTHEVTTVAGTGRFGGSGDGGPAVESEVAQPYGVATDLMGNLYITDKSWRIRRINFGAKGVDRLSISSGGRQNLFLGNTSAPLEVVAASAAGTPISGLAVEFRIARGEGRLSSASAVTDETGRAAVRFTAGLHVATAAVEASAQGLNSVSFDLSAVPLPTPRINPSGVVGAGLSAPPLRALAPGSIASVFGNYFAAGGTAAVVTDADLVDGRLPFNLANVCVGVGGQRAPIFAVLPGQVNFQVPEVAPGSDVQVNVITNCEQSNTLYGNPTPITVQAAAPEFFYFSQTPDGNNLIAAVDAVTGVFVGPPGLFSSVTTAPIGAGGVVVLFATGLGATTPPTPPGAIPEEAARVNAPLKVTLAGREAPAADVLYAGVTPGNAGLYQINLRVPADTPEGSAAVILTVAGVDSPAGYISVRH